MSENPKLFHFIIVVILVILFWAITPIIIISTSDILPESILKILESAGPIGDSYGILNSLFTGLALGAIVFAIFIQTAQLKLQRREVDATLDHLQNENEWNRVKLKMDVLPLLCERNIVKINSIMGENFISSGTLFESLETIADAPFRVDVEIKNTEGGIEFEKIKLKRIADEIQHENNLTVSEKESRREDNFKRAQNGESDIGFFVEEKLLEKKKSAEKNINSYKNEKERYLFVKSLISEIETYQSDLVDAYKNAKNI